MEKSSFSIFTQLFFYSSVKDVIVALYILSIKLTFKHFFIFRALYGSIQVQVVKLSPIDYLQGVNNS